MSRIYNGCPDSELQAKLDEEEAAMQRLKKLRPEALCTHFPGDGTYVVHEWGKTLSEYRMTKMEAILEALDNVKKCGGD